MQTRARMTFRFDTPPSSVRPAGHDADRLEEMIRRSGTEAVAAAPQPKIRDMELAPERERERERGSEPEQDPVSERESLIDPSVWQRGQSPNPAVPMIMSEILSARGGPSWWKVFVSVAAAIATGALFGYLVLTLFTGQAPFPGKNAADSASPPRDATASIPSPSKPNTSLDAASGGMSASSAGTPAVIPEAAYYVLQYGVFRSEDSMIAAVGELKNKGLPAADERSDSYRVYAGASATKEEANLLAAQLPGIEVYVKAFALKAVNLSESSESGEMAQFVNRSDDLIRALSQWSVAALQETDQQPADNKRLADLRESHRIWLASAPAAGRATGPSAVHAAGTVVQVLNAAMKAVDDYGGKRSRFHLWGVQSDVLKAVMAERELRSALAEGSAT